MLTLCGLGGLLWLVLILNIGDKMKTFLISAFFTLVACGEQARSNTSPSTVENPSSEVDNVIRLPDCRKLVSVVYIHENGLHYMTRPFRVGVVGLNEEPETYLYQNDENPDSLFSFRVQFIETCVR